MGHEVTRKNSDLRAGTFHTVFTPASVKTISTQPLGIIALNNLLGDFSHFSHGVPFVISLGLLCDGYHIT